LPQVRNEKGKEFAFEIPLNPGGGLIGDGHPVGATGVRQVVEAYQHLTGQRRAPVRNRNAILPSTWAEA
jgi:acetyl-CoA acetyltransferase